MADQMRISSPTHRRLLSDSVTVPASQSTSSDDDIDVPLCLRPHSPPALSTSSSMEHMAVLPPSSSMEHMTVLPSSSSLEQMAALASSLEQNLVSPTSKAKHKVNLAEMQKGFVDEEEDGEPVVLVEKPKKRKKKRKTRKIKNRVSVDVAEVSFIENKNDCEEDNNNGDAGDNEDNSGGGNGDISDVIPPERSVSQPSRNSGRVSLTTSEDGGIVAAHSDIGISNLYGGLHKSAAMASAQSEIAISSLYNNANASQIVEMPRNRMLHSKSSASQQTRLPIAYGQIIIKAEFPIKGIDARVAIKVSPKLLIEDVIKMAFSELKLGEAKSKICEKYEFVATNEDGIVLDNKSFVKKCGLCTMETIKIKPKSNIEQLETELSLSASSEILDTESVHKSFIKAGYLKMRKHAVFCFERKRWVVLQDRILYYFESPKNLVSLGSLNLEQSTILFYLNSAKIANIFTVSLFNGKSYQFQCETKEEAESWKNAIFNQVYDGTDKTAAWNFMDAKLTSFVFHKGSKRWLFLTKDKRISLFNSPADKKEYVGINLYNAKVLFISKSNKIVFTGYDIKIKVTFIKEEDFIKWKNLIREDLAKMRKKKVICFKT